MLLTPGNLSCGGTVGRSPGRQRDGTVFINIYWKHTQKKPQDALDKNKLNIEEQESKTKGKPTASQPAAAPAFSFPPIDSAAYAHLPAQVTAGQEHITTNKCFHLRISPYSWKFICVRQLQSRAVTFSSQLGSSSLFSVVVSECRCENNRLQTTTTKKTLRTSLIQVQGQLYCLLNLTHKLKDTQ